MLARVAAMANASKANRAADWARLQAKAPEVAAWATAFYRHTKARPSIVCEGERFGQAPTPRRTPPIPGVR